ARDGPAAAMNLLRETGRALLAGPGTLLSDPAIAAWLVRTSLAAGDESLAPCISGAAGALAKANPGFPALAAAAAHTKGLASRNTDLLAEATAVHPDKWARASAAEDLAVLLGATCLEQTIRCLKSALGGYDQIGAERDSARVRRRLRKLGIRRRHWTTLPGRPVTGWASLTGTEQAVAGLVAEGLNNQQVASRIFLSTHSVAHYLRQIFRRLHIRSRVELARIVLEESS
ncbi:MAG TPA: helix-turn-helix transcriptional regulator, partial [Acidimicrobiales bacterium]|nr:helix-turn-helix transcriptional regulator [Acidimicrobiales bacterium]